jgi:ATP-dependent DNA helicase RecG
LEKTRDEWPEIDFVDDRDGCLFTATVHWATIDEAKSTKMNGENSKISSEKSSQQEILMVGEMLKSTEEKKKSSEIIISLLKNNPKLTAREIAPIIGIGQRAVEKQIAGLRRKGRLRRIGSTKGGHWEVQ